LLDRLWLDGVEGICPTFVSCSPDRFQLGMKVLKEAKKHTSKNSCRLLGAHMEGPFLCESFSGAHDKESICKPSISALNERIKGFEDEIALMTLAPELKGSMDVISRLRELKIVVSLGHSSADFDSAMNAFNNGVTMVTHTFNAMKGLHHRAIGPIGAAARRDDIFLGLIADGVHVHSDMIKLLKILAPKQIVLVSDAISAYGLGDGSFNWDKRSITVENGLCKLPNETIAGSTLPLLDACKKIAKWINDPSAAIWMATLAPRMVLSQKKMTSKSFFTIFTDGIENRLGGETKSITRVCSDLLVMGTEESINLFCNGFLHCYLQESQSFYAGHHNLPGYICMKTNLHSRTYPNTFHPQRRKKIYEEAK